MITGELKSRIDAIWNDFWSGGIANPLEVMEQLTLLLFIKGLDEAQAREENKANATKSPIEHPIFLDGDFTPDGLAVGRPYADMRWHNFRSLPPREMYDLIDRYVFPFIQQRAADSTHAPHMKGARFTIPAPNLLAKVVDALDAIPMQDRDTKGDVYEYMLSKIASAGQNGQFRTPRHIIQLMVEMTAPKADDVICDPACGTCGFLVAASEYVRNNHSQALANPKSAKHFSDEMFHGYDFDNTMLRIGSMNMQLHGVQNPNITYRDSLSQEHGDDASKYTLVLANPPFAGSLDYESTAKDLLQIVRTKKTELLFLALFLRMLKPGGRAAVIVPDGVLFGSTSAHKALRKLLVDEQNLQGVVSLPSGAFKPYAGVSTAILLFQRTDSRGDENVWFYDVKADGRSLDDKRVPLLSEDKLGALAELTDDEHSQNNLPDALRRWNFRQTTELQRVRTDQSFCVPKAEIASNEYDLSINRYKEVVHEEVEYDKPQVVLDELAALQEDIQKGIDELRAMLR